MKRKNLLALLILMCAPVFGTEHKTARYGIITTKSSYAPVRTAADINAKRFAHLTKGVNLYTYFETPEFYGVDLGEKSPYWIEKKYVDCPKAVKEKKFHKIKKIKITENDKWNFIEIKLDNVFPYREVENKNSLDFILYDTKIPERILKKYKNNEFYTIKTGSDNSVIITAKQRKTPINGYETVKKGSSLVFKVKKPFDIDKKNPLKDLVFVIDPGHGGSEYGAVAFNLKEKDLNLAISKLLKDELEKEGAIVYMTREKDEYKGLYERVDFAKKVDGDFLISIHQNSLPDRKNVNKKHGSGVYYYNKETYPLALEIQNSLLKKTGFRNDGVNHSSLALNRASSPLSVLVECGYIIHPAESAKLNNPDFQKTVSKAIKDGVKNYLTKNY